jgi:hypothetical protein
MSRRAITVAVGLLLVAGLAAGIARAMIPDAAGMIHGCFKTKNGQLRVVQSANELCKKDVTMPQHTFGPNNEELLDWRQTGAPGAQGQQGPQGPFGQQGPQGDPGPDGLGVTGYRIVTQSGTTTKHQNGDAWGEALAVCPQFTTLVGGGFELPSAADVTVMANEPEYQLSSDEWRAEVWGTAGVSFTAYAVCVDQQPLEGS